MCEMNCADLVAVDAARVLVIARPSGGRLMLRCVRGDDGIRQQSVHGPGIEVDGLGWVGQQVPQPAEIRLRRNPERSHDVLGIPTAVRHPLNSAREHPIALLRGVGCRRHNCSITRPTDPLSLRKYP